jgi:hypothetical protein
MKLREARLLPRMPRLTRASLIYVSALACLVSGASASPEPSIARTWNEEILAAIRIDRPNPPVHARNLFHLAVCMYDAWAAYDTTAVGYIHHERLSAQDLEAERKEAISYAAYRVLRARYSKSANAVVTQIAIGRRMAALGYPTANTNVIGNSPAAVGNRIAADILGWGAHDGCNESGAYEEQGYLNPQPAMTVLKFGVPQGGGVPFATDPNRWQPLTFDLALTQNGLIADKVQKYIGVTWLKTCPFALDRADPSKPWIDPGGPSRLGTKTDAQYKAGALSLLRDCSRLGSETLIDISPGAGGFGNNSLGKDDGAGHSLNPATNAAYEKNPARLGDYARVIAEFWADGPKSETPPGHWHVLANHVADSPLAAKRIAGQGRVLDDLEWDVKAYFALSAATHDAACVAWGLKRYYEGTRPITMIRYMGGKGQCSDRSLPSFHHEGLPLEPGVVELITAETAAPGDRHQGVGKAGEIAVFSWPGEPADPKTQTSAPRWMRAVDWFPYQRKSFNTPAFPGYISGHSTFSRAAAEVLAAMTGSPYFPGGILSFTAKENSYLVFERGPTQAVTLQWATYYDAADQAGLSRRWGGIHVPEDDYAGRIAGAQAGRQAWELAQKYWDGSILKEPVVATAIPLANGELKVEWKTRRGLYYQLETSSDQKTWSIVESRKRATDTTMSWTGTKPAAAASAFRVLASASASPLLVGVANN